MTELILQVRKPEIVASIELSMNILIVKLSNKYLSVNRQLSP